MNILHLSDLHLGKRIFELSMLDEQRAILKQALAFAREADLTIIAGDIYDRQVPAAEAVTLFDDFLTRMSVQGSPVVLIAGNHDSAERIAFGAGLMDRSGVYVSPVYDGKPKRVVFSDAYGEVHVYLLPFIKPAHVRAALEEEAIEGYTNAMAAAIERMELDPACRNVLVAHQFVTGAARSESEEISVGGLDNVDAEVFEAFDYVALGHLHTQQSLLGGRVRYCGAPLCYSFGEAGQEKSAWMITLGPKGELSAKRMPFVPLHAMRRVRGSFDELAAGEENEDYLEITLTDEDDIPDAMGRLRAVYPNALQLRYDNMRTRAAEADFSRERRVSQSPMELFEELYEMQNGAPLSHSQRSLLAGMMEKIWEDEV